MNSHQIVIKIKCGDNNTEEKYRSLPTIKRVLSLNKRLSQLSKLHNYDVTIRFGGYHKTQKIAAILKYLIGEQ